MRPPWGNFGLPPDAVAWTALSLALALTWTIARRGDACLRLVRGLPPTGAVLGLAALASALSWGYVAFYLRGGPRIIDATSYYLEARALADGALAFPVPDPSGSFRGRFLVNTPTGELSVLFPPGYPALLALGFLASAPLAVGPLLAAALVVLTYRLGRELFGSAELGLLAALLSALSAVLRYHTADTMSHGWTAVLLAGVVLAGHRRTPRGALVAGLCAGVAFATRPVSGLWAMVLGLLFLVRTPRRLALFVPALLPGVSLLGAHQLIATGDAFGSVQQAYYAIADGPPGCFGYGLGAQLGCRVEHGDFVRARLPDGFGWWPALGTTLRRLYWHLPDAANCELLALLVPVAVARGRRLAAVRWLGVAVFGLVAAYLPFYFDATYPGGGARLYADVLPFEHLLIAWALLRFKVARWTAPAVLAGFALHTVFDHRLLAEREGGRPMFEPDVLAAAGITRGLVFVNTDHGFNLGHRPGDRALVVARRRRDAHDALLWRNLGRPDAWMYDFDPTRPRAAPTLRPLELEAGGPLRFEAEAEWPPLLVRGGWAHIDYPGSSCVSGGRSLRLRAHHEPIRVVVPITAPHTAQYELEIGWTWRGPAPAQASFTVAGFSHAVLVAEPCARARYGPIPLREGAHALSIATASDTLALDYVELLAIPGG